MAGGKSETESDVAEEASFSYDTAAALAEPTAARNVASTWARAMEYARRGLIDATLANIRWREVPHGAIPTLNIERCGWEASG
jgi:hypothetical protein